MNEVRLIDANALKKVIFSKSDGMEDLWDTAGVLNAINNAPTIKSPDICYIERPQGELVEDNNHNIVCPFCGAKLKSPPWDTSTRGVGDN